MAPHESERIWDLARGRLAGAGAETVRAHVAACPECAEAFAAAQSAVEAMRDLAPPPRAPNEWKAVDDAVLQHARARLEAGPLQRLGERLSDLFTPRWTIAAAVAAAVLVGLVLWRPEPPAPRMTPSPSVALRPPPNVPLAPDAPESAQGDSVAHAGPEDAQGDALAHAGPEDARVAQVIAAVHASSDADDSLSQGARVQTHKNGEAVLRLPEGSAVDLRADSSATLAALSPQEIRLQVDRGELVVAATHRDARTFEVVAGDATVRVVGTRFAVSRTLNGAIVRVTEGKVRVTAHVEETFVSGGEELTVTPTTTRKRTLGEDIQRSLAPVIAKLEGIIQPMPKVPDAPDAPAPRTEIGSKPSQSTSAQAQARAAPDAGTIAGTSLPSATSSNDSATAEKATAHPGSDADEWALPPLGTTADAGTRNAPTTANPTTRDAGQPWINGAVDNMKKWLAVDWNAPFPPVGMTMVEYRVRQMEHLADAGRCKPVLKRADAWVAEFVTKAATPPDPELHRTVELTRARCLEKLGRVDEAKKVRARWP